MPRGGRRPGAGAPRGNMNAFRHGKSSAQYQRLLEILSADPEAIRLVEEIALGDQARKKRNRREALATLDHVLERMGYEKNDRIAAAYEAARAIPGYTGSFDDDWLSDETE